MGEMTTLATCGQQEAQEVTEEMKRLSRMKEGLLDLLEMHGELEDRGNPLLQLLEEQHGEAVVGDVTFMRLYAGWQKRKLLALLDAQDALERGIRDGLYGSGPKQNRPLGGGPTGEYDNAA